MGRAVSLYIHVPFCSSICPYCDFYKKVPRENEIDEYVSAVCKLLKREEYSSFSFDTLYFGGGTPALLSERQLEKIFSALENRLLKGSEVTIECNPGNISEDYFKNIFSLGVNRLSLGVQSFDDEALRFLGRRHTSEDAIKAIEKAKTAGFSNITIDMMIGLPKGNPSSIDKTAEILKEYSIPHLSSYILKVEEGTLFHKRGVMELLPEEEDISKMYLYVGKALSEIGLFQYEVSNYSKEGYESRHNLKYWRCEEYLGLGPGAHSFFEGKRFYCENNLNKFIQKVNSGDCVFTGFSEGGSLEEYAMLRLRLKEGLSRKDTLLLYGNEAENIFKKAALFPKNHLFKFDGEKISLTPEGFLLSNQIIERLVL